MKNISFFGLIILLIVLVFIINFFSEVLLVLSILGILCLIILAVKLLNKQEAVKRKTNEIVNRNEKKSEDYLLRSIKECPARGGLLLLHCSVPDFRTGSEEHYESFRSNE